MSDVILLLGSNLGNRKLFLAKAIALIESEIGHVVKKSLIYESEPWGFDSDKFFLNQALIVETLFPPQAVLEKIKKIERDLGRERKSPAYKNRTIDIDILFYDNVIYKSEKLVIPHPQTHLRKFTMVPLIEIAGDYIHPVLRQRLDIVATNFTDNKAVELFEPGAPALTIMVNEI